MNTKCKICGNSVELQTPPDYENNPDVENRLMPLVCCDTCFDFRVRGLTMYVRLTRIGVQSQFIRSQRQWTQEDRDKCYKLIEGAHKLAAGIGDWSQKMRARCNLMKLHDLFPKGYYEPVATWAQILEYHHNKIQALIDSGFQPQTTE